MGDGRDEGAVVKDAKSVRRERKRKMMVSYRKEKKNEETELKLMYKQLEKEVQALRAASTESSQRRPVLGALSWKDIALALYDEATSCQVEYESLKRQLQAKSRLLHYMKLWIVCNSNIAVSPNPVCPTWQHCTLTDNPASRHLGMEWIAQQLYHNLDRVLARYPFTPHTPSTDDFSAKVEFTETGNEYFLSWQFVTNQRHVIERCRDRMCEALMANLFFPVESSTIHECHRHTLLHRMVSKTGDHVNLLVGVFPGADRTVLVTRQILQDDARGAVPQQRNRSAWFEFVATASGATHARVVLHCSHRITKDGPVAMPVEARMWGCDLSAVPERLWESRLQRDVLRLMPISLAKVRSTLGM